ncbi:phosphotransferase family protein [Sporichthya brevicatena]|uniref:phosphotransferase family protein n=1 Tax=Sporichthya brevicatena TaxID=171442 RepID=UPI0031CF92AC
MLTSWAQAHYGPSAAVDQVAPMPGHAGISFGFDVRSDSAEERLVIRVAPPGVRRSGPADVLRQVPVLQAAAVSGVPVAGVRWWSDDERWFGSPYFVVDRLPGSSLSCWEPLEETGSDADSIFAAAVDALAAIHRIDWRRQLSDWAEPRSLEAEIRAWEPVLRKGRNEAWIAFGLALHEELLRTRPPEPAPAVVHGDFYSNNWVCQDGKLLGVVDWEIAGIGAPLLDVGWLMMIYDPACWGPTRRPWMTWSPPPEQLGDAYRSATGDRSPDLAWYQGLACWRFAAITAMNLHLHRSGNRPDETWELIGEAFEPMVARGLELARA